jgi:hypothetical protein
MNQKNSSLQIRHPIEVQEGKKSGWLEAALNQLHNHRS